MTITGTITEPTIQAVSGRDDLYRMADPWRCPIGHGQALEVDAGFLLDGGSIPRWAWSIVGHPLQGRALPGFAVHDALYASELLTRAECDKVLFAINKKCGVPAWKRAVFYSCVVAAGWAVWRKHTPASVEAARKLVRIQWETIR